MEAGGTGPTVQPLSGQLMNGSAIRHIETIETLVCIRNKILMLESSNWWRLVDLYDIPPKSDRRRFEKFTPDSRLPILELEWQFTDWSNLLTVQVQCHLTYPVFHLLPRASGLKCGFCTDPPKNGWCQTLSIKREVATKHARMVLPTR